MEDKTDSEMTADERLTWLRERGIEVTTPEERRASSVAQALYAADALETSSSLSQVSYVMIPADTSKPLQEFTFSPSPDAVGDALLHHLKPVFASKGNENAVDLSLLQQHSTTTTLAAGNSKNDPALNVSEATLRQVATEGHVEVFCLVPPAPSNQFTAIHIYLDEVGMLKRLPLNPRASEYAKRAGFEPPPVFYGNVYLGRVKQQQQQINNVSFVLGPDTALDAPWLLTAVQENLQHQLQKNRLLSNGINSTSAPEQPPLPGQDGQDKAENGYSWTQTELDLEIKVPITPASAADTAISSKDIKVIFQPTWIQVSFRNEVILRLDLLERIDVDSCTWTLENNDNNKSLLLSMEKLEEAYWPRIQD